ncbi:hypothetical protein ACA910_010032 [Epithemia clementina (nom. ined.)]
MNNVPSPSTYGNSQAQRKDPPATDVASMETASSPTPHLATKGSSSMVIAAPAATASEPSSAVATSAASSSSAAAAAAESSPNLNQNNNNSSFSHPNHHNGHESDLAVAHRLQAVEQLTSIFGFPASVAEQAVDAVGWNVTTCYNYILDQNLAQDSGGPITPIDNCPHLQRHVQVTIATVTHALQGEPPQDAPCSRGQSDMHNATTATSNDKPGSLKEDVNQDGSCPSKENWMCLECGVIRCSRYKNGHALVHWEETKQESSGGEGHCIAVSFSDLSVWCYLCSAYVRHSILISPLVRQLEHFKFASPPPSTSSATTNMMVTDDGDSRGAAQSAQEEQQQQQQQEQRTYGSLSIRRTPPPAPLGDDDDDDVAADGHSTPPSMMDSASKHHSTAQQIEKQNPPLQPQQQQHHSKGFLPHILSPVAPSPTRKKQRTSILAPNLDMDVPADTITDDRKDEAMNTNHGNKETETEERGADPSDDERMQTEPEHSDCGDHDEEEDEGGDDGDEEDDEEPRKMPARGVPLDFDDEPTEGEHGDHDDEDEEEDDEVDANLIQMLAQAAAAQGVSLEWIIEQARAEQDAEDGQPQPVEYPFERFPTNLADVAEFIQSEKCRRILILAGAGMSVSSGIPDFRSAGTGLYSTLNANLLTCTAAQQEAIRQDPSFALDQHLFLENPLPLLETKRDFILGTYEQRWKATLAHRFVELLHVKTGKLVRLYTQNIDGLEDQCTQLPEDKVIPVHGTMDRAECARCKTRTGFADFCHQVRNQIKDITGRDPTAPSVSTSINCSTCGYNSLKPAIVLFRSSMPQEFFANVGPDVRNVDLLIIIGTSLKVAPANSLVWRVPRSALRVLVNREIVGEHLGMDFYSSEQQQHQDNDHDDSDNENNNENNRHNDHQPTNPIGGRDFFAGGNCDDVLLELMEHLGWLSDLESLLVEQQLPQSSASLLQERLASSRRAGDGSGSGSPSAAAVSTTTTDAPGGSSTNDNNSENIIHNNAPSERRQSLGEPSVPS